MNYFELFELPVQFNPDKDLLKQKFFELSRKYHPDYFANASDEEQQKSLEVSALLNKAYKTLTNQDTTIAYILSEKGLLETNEKYNLDPAFLMEMMELNESFAEAKFDEDPNTKVKLYHYLSELEKEIYEPIEKILEHYQDGVTTQEELLQVKDYYFKKKYLERLRQQLK